MNPLVYYALTGAGAYLVGSIPFGVLIGRFRGVDVTCIGSGNIGAANVGRALGLQWGLAVLLLDVLKGLVPVLLIGLFARELFGESAMHSSTHLVGWLVSGFCAVIGHNFSIFLGFRGGKGVATSLGIALGYYPDLTWPALAAVVAYAAVLGIWRISSVGSMSGSVIFFMTYCILAWFRTGSLLDRWPFLLFTVFVTGLILVKHRSNIARLIVGTESPLWTKKR